MDEEERIRLRDLEIRRRMEQKSVEFFNQFKYGDMLRKAIPKIRYNSEIRPEKSSDARLSDVEVKIRLSRLNESASRINELIPKWSSMLMTTRETNREEQISKTLTNARHILDRKVDRAKEMLARYIDVSGSENPTEEMEDIKRHSELVQLDMNSLERMFAAHEKQLADELDEPSSISP
uniref:Multimerin-2 n=1 Tax=Lygus hesperus TaxID=30085 RepID=A0A0A9YLL5_LYGHE